MQYFSDPGLIILVFSMVVVLVSCLLMWLNKILGTFLGNSSSRKHEKQFECGLNPTSQSSRLSINYFLIAVAFLVFELEGAILFSWAVNFWQLGIGGVITATIFIIILLLGLFYMLAQGVLSS